MSRASKGRLVAVARGLDAAQKAIHAVADGEDGRARAILNAQSYEDVVWAAGYLLSCLHEMATLMAAGDPKETRRLLHAGADGAGDDVSVAEAEVIVADAFSRDVTS
jgi:elongation factor P hydroxylase